PGRGRVVITSRTMRLVGGSCITKTVVDQRASLTWCPTPPGKLGRWSRARRAKCATRRQAKLARALPHPNRGRHEPTASRTRWRGDRKRGTRGSPLGQTKCDVGCRLIPLRVRAVILPALEPSRKRDTSGERLERTECFGRPRGCGDGGREGLRRRGRLPVGSRQRGEQNAAESVAGAGGVDDSRCDG